MNNENIVHSYKGQSIEKVERYERAYQASRGGRFITSYIIVGTRLVFDRLCEAKDYIDRDGAK